MALDIASQLGETLGILSNIQDDMQQNMSPDENQAQDQMSSRFIFEIGGTVILNQNTYATDSFILDHPVYGELDSAVLKLDGGYSGSPVQLYSDTF